jgi:uncharacterized OB-fold protein
MSMPRSILSGSYIRPIWQRGRYRIEGADEDVFTLGLEALARLGVQVHQTGPRSLQRLHLVGTFSTEADWGYGEALGIPGIEVRHHPPSGSGLWGALAAAAHDEGSTGREAVVAADLTSSENGATAGSVIHHGAGAAAFLFGKEPGLAVLRHGFRGHAPGRSPTMRASVASWLDAIELLPSEKAAEVVFASDEDPSRWQAAWEETAPGITVTLADPRSAGPPLRAAFLLWELGRRLRTGHSGMVAESLRGRSGFAGFRLDGPVRWLGDWGENEPGISPLSESLPVPPSVLGTVSQGAYVPHARYLENLASRWRLVGERCAHCGALTFPVAGRCRSCGRTDALHGEGLPHSELAVEAVTTISPGAQPTEFDPVVEATGGYDVAVVALGSDARATVQVTDTVPGQLRVGDHVALVLRRLYPMEGEWRYGLKAVPETIRSRAPESVPSVSRPPGARASKISSAAPTARRAIPRGRVARSASRRRRGR